MRDRLNESLKTAMRAKDQAAVSTLRLILAAIKEKDIAARTEDRCQGATDAEILQILQKMIRQRQESSATYESAGRLDLAEQERQEIEIIRQFMPKQMESEEIREACSAVVQEIGAEGLKDMGKCMGALKQRYAGRMDFSAANVEVKKMLS